MMSRDSNWLTSFLPYVRFAYDDPAAAKVYRVNAAYEFDAQTESTAYGNGVKTAFTGGGVASDVKPRHCLQWCRKV